MQSEVSFDPGPASMVRILILPSGKVNRENAAKAMGRTPKTLAEWARLGIGPRPQKIQGRIFYEWTEVQEFMGAM
ncbi:MAG TPA: hypothetical protein VEC11_01245 [Allosphingosinicella sp.]|nr:hypothetical protein [Allosphingosinicella sp.]